MSRSEHFPLVGDDEVVTEPPRLMELYEDSDLITNIQGDYEEPSFVSPKKEDWEPPAAKRQSQVKERNRQAHLQATKSANTVEKSPGQLAREEARQDLKKKRSAPYLNQNKPFKSKSLPKPQPSKRDLEQDQISKLTAAANRLEQEDYIVAEMAPNYQPPQNEPVVTKKNSYDFLRTSRIYKEEGKSREKKRAQELNLTRFEQKDTL